MDILEIILTLIEETSNTKTTECSPEPDDLELFNKKTAQDIKNCGEAHKKIEQGDYNQVTTLVRYKQVDSDDGRTTTAVKIKPPSPFDKLIDYDITSCYSEISKSVKKEPKK